MNWRNVFLIFRREVLDQLRDRRTLFMVAILPILLYPLMGIGMVQMTLLITEHPRTIVILGAADLAEPPLLHGRRFSDEWFHSVANAEKLRVLTDLDETRSIDANKSTEPTTSEPVSALSPANVATESQEPSDLALHGSTASIEISKTKEPLPSKEQIADDEQKLDFARQIRELIVQRQKLESEIEAAHKGEHLSEASSLERTLKELNSRLTNLFDRSGIQVLILVPHGFARDVAKHQELLSHREQSEYAAFDYPRPLIIQNSADQKSGIAYRRVESVVSAWERAILKNQLQQSHLPEALTEPVKPVEIDLAEQEQVSANVFSQAIPALLVIMTLTGAFYPAVDLCAGEKERGTMETLLICPATRTEIVLGKFVTVLLFSMSTALLNLMSIGFTGKYTASLALGGASSRLGDLSLPPLSSLAWVVVILIPLATLFSALCLAIATFAKSSKEGQYYLTPLLMVTLGLTMFCMFPTAEMSPFYSVMPVVGPGLLLKGLLKANGPGMEMYLYAIPVLVTSIGYSLLALWWAIEQFGNEEVLFREAERFDLRLWIKHLLRDKEPVPTFTEAGFCFLLILILQFSSWKSFQTALQSTPKESLGLFQIQLTIMQQIALIATPALMMGVILTTSVRRTFSLRWPGFRRLLCAVLLPFTLQPLTTELLISLQWFFPPLPPGMAEMMGQMRECHVLLVLLALAVTPAICEEIAFRGFLLAGFRRMGKVKLAVVLSSCAFGAIHMIPQQVFNATLLGLILGAMCVQNRSIIPGMAFHFVYNSLSILHERFGDRVPTEQAWNFFFRMEDGALRYQPALLCLLSLLCIGLLHRLLQPAAIADIPETIESVADSAINYEVSPVVNK